MTVESGSFISDFNTALPAAGDLKSEGDDHIRNIKTWTKATFPNVTGAVTATHTALNSAAAGTVATLFPGLGTVGAPAYSFTGDTDTGMWSPAANVLAWSTGGTERGRFTGGDLGIGTATPNKLAVSRAITVNGATNGALEVAAADVSIGWMFGNSSRLTLETNGAIPITFNTNGSERLRVETDGRVYGSALHNNAGAVTGTTNQYIASGTYTPTLTGGTNVSATSQPNPGWQWIRVGNVVTCSGQVRVSFTAGGGAGSSFGLSVPIASTFTNAANASGTAVSYTSAGDPGAVLWVSGATVAVNLFASTSGSHDYAVMFTYVIL